ncbi:MAG: hypothetical protein Q8N77_04695, partial [Nanoarchaeota archaeon]|nr:hypothetical protein [Nanoarchaeota archaeon]
PYRGVGNVPNIFVTVKIYLYQGNLLLKEDAWNYKLEVNSQKIYLTDKHSAYSLDYKNIPVRFSKDSKIEFIITRNSEDFIDFKIKNIASEPVERQLILDYYCENLVDRTSFLINDYYSYLGDLFMLRISNERYTGTPSIILPNEEIRLQIPKLNCATHILILRKESEYYVTPY